jgi:hypothetical protein
MSSTTVSRPVPELLDIVLTPKHSGVDLYRVRRAAEYALVRATEEALTSGLATPLNLEKPRVVGNTVVISTRSTWEDLALLEHLDVENWDPILSEVSISLVPRGTVTH